MPARTRSRGLLGYLELPVFLVLALGLTLGVKANVAQAFSIPSESMQPQLQVGDRVLVSRTAYRLHDVHRGDIIVFPSPTAPPDHDGLVRRTAGDVLESIGLKDPGDDDLIKRVVGLPGETVSGQDGHVVVDGRTLVEPYLPDGVRTDDFGPVAVPLGRVFVMGDNRGNSADSRIFGPVPQSTVVGRAFARVWPIGHTSFL
jgi:signal peptidase I